MPKRRQSRGEEIANSVSHGVGSAAAIAATPFLVLAARNDGAAAIVGVSIFAATMIVLYSASMVYHALPHSRAKRVFRTFDHSAIYLLIAGTYTPFTLAVLPGAWGWTLFGIVWGLAALGVVLKSIGALRHPVLSTALYVTIGWLAIVAVRPLWIALPPAALIWLLVGGLAYTGGVAFYATDQRRYHHFVWHLCVLCGTTCHVCAVLGYAV
jgi:hemolysin III